MLAGWLSPGAGAVKPMLGPPFSPKVLTRPSSPPAQPVQLAQPARAVPVVAAAAVGAGHFREQSLKSSGFRWTAGCLAALALWRGRARQSTHTSKSKARASRAGRAAAGSEVETSLEATLEEACRACLEVVQDSDGLASTASDRPGLRWSMEVDEEICEGTAYYSRFRIDSIPAGHATTVGNIMRRTLLRHDLFRTHAPVAFRVHHRSFNIVTGDKLHLSGRESAQHEYASVPGVQESMLDVMRNVQQMTISQVGTSSKATDAIVPRGQSPEGTPQTWSWGARLCGPCAVQAQDLDIVDSASHFETTLALPLPYQHLFLVTSPEMLELEVAATCCSQHEWDEGVEFEKYKQRLRFDGWLIAPPIFSPVKKVNYLVTGCESDAGKETVQLEVWTTKASKPSRLVRTSASTLLSGLLAGTGGRALSSSSPGKPETEETEETEEAEETEETDQ